MRWSLRVQLGDRRLHFRNRLRRHCTRVSDRIRDHIKKAPPRIKKAPPRKYSFDINAAITEVIALARSEVIKNGALVKTNLAERLSPACGDQVQLQQIMLNLTLNSVEAMSSVSDRHL